MIFDLAQDFRDAAAAMPKEHPKHRMLELLEKAIRRDIHFIARHPTTLFQCMWNTCWWYDCPEAAKHYEFSDAEKSLPWEGTGVRLYRFTEAWRTSTAADGVRWNWLRSLRPPVLPLDTGPAAVLRGHMGPVNSVDVSPDGRRVVSGASDCTVRIWNASGEEEFTLSAHTGVVTAVAWAPQCDQVASGSADQTVRIWDARRGTQSRCIMGHSGTVTCVAFAPGADRIAGGCEDGTVHIWEISSGEVQQRFTVSDRRVNAIAFRPDGQVLVVGADDSTRNVLLVDINTGTVTHAYRRHQDFISSVAFSPDGVLVGSCSAVEESSLHVWRAETGEMVWMKRRPPGYLILDIAFAPDSLQVATASVSKRVEIWAARDGQLLASIPHSDTASAVTFFPDGKALVTAGHDGAVRIWETDLARGEIGLAGHQDDISAIDFLRDGYTLATASDHHLKGDRRHCPWRDYSVRLWDANTGLQLRRETYNCGITELAFDHCGSKLRFASWDGSKYEWRRDTGGSDGLESDETPDNRPLTETEQGDIGDSGHSEPAFGFRCCLRADQGESVLEDAADGTALAWFPDPLKSILPHPTGYKWAAATRSHLWLLSLVIGDTDLSLPWVPKLEVLKALATPKAVVLSRDSSPDSVWNVMHEPGTRPFALTATCRDCGYIEDYEPLQGDKLPARCPCCGKAGANV